MNNDNKSKKLYSSNNNGLDNNLIQLENNVDNLIKGIDSNNEKYSTYHIPINPKTENVENNLEKDLFQDKIHKSLNNINTSNTNNNHQRNDFVERLKDNDNKTNKTLKYKKNKRYVSYEKRLACLIVLLFISIIIFVTFLIKIMKYISNNTDTFSENSSSKYSVCLFDNDYYDESCLEEGRQYLSSLVDNIPYIFTYNALYDDAIDKKYTYYVNAHLKIFAQDNEAQTLYEKIYTLLDKKEYQDKNSVFTISDNIIIPFKQYNDFVVDYNNNNALLSTSEITVNFYVNDNVVSTITIPLGKQTFNITKSDKNNSVSIDKNLTSNINSKTQFYFIVLLISGITFVVHLILLLRFLVKYHRKDDGYAKYLKGVNNILKNYDRIIVEVKDISKLLENKNIIKVKSFLELVDVRDTLEKPILHLKINSIKNGFYVDDKDKIYCFVMKFK